MRALAILAVLAVVAGCSTTPEAARKTRAAAEKEQGGQRVMITPVCGASVEDAGVMYCAKCGVATDERGACGCNRLGMPGFGIEPTGRVKRSTSPR